ncbi:MAG: DUF3592 domain-containing protein [Deltaproteobacteria bacterium]|nr:DUF3592 domain-containing protein [Deltaproteobacteria bacterium]
MTVPRRTNPASGCMLTFFTRVFPLLFILLGGGMLVWGGWNMWRAWEAQSWPSVPGEVIHSDTRFSPPSSNSKSSGSFWPDVRYRYTVSGVVHEGDQVTASDYGGSLAHAREVSGRYRVGQRVEVHYEPGDPREALLEPGLALSSLLLPGVGLAFLTAGLFIWFIFARALKHQRNAPDGETGGAGPPPPPGRTETPATSWTTAGTAAPTQGQAPAATKPLYPRRFGQRPRWPSRQAQTQSNPQPYATGFTSSSGGRYADTTAPGTSPDPAAPAAGLTCPRCGAPTPRGRFRVWQILLAVVLFPEGLLALMLGRGPATCPQCGHQWQPKAQGK